MAALSDPRAFMSAQEKRAQQMKAMGIEETDINTKDLKEGDGICGTGKKGSKCGDKKEEKRGLPLVGGWWFPNNVQNNDENFFSTEDFKLEPINVETLRLEKVFQKTAKKQQKELDILKKKQMKEKGLAEKTQCSAIEKVVKGRE